MSSYNPIDEDIISLPIFNETNYNTGDGVVLTQTESDTRYLRKIGGTVSGNITVSTGDVQIQKGSLYIYDVNNSVYVNGHIALSDTIMFAKNYIDIGDINSTNNFKITQNGSSAFPGSTDFSFTGTGILNFKYDSVNKIVMDIVNGKMAINSTTVDATNKLYVNGNTSINGTLTCSSLTTSVSLIPTGITMLWGSNIAPTGWLLCNGASYSKVANNNLYKPLYDVIQYTFGGSGDNFNVPNFTNRFPYGATSSIGSIGGNITAQLTDNNIPPHTHTYQRYKADDSFRRAAASTGDYYFWGNDNAGEHDDATIETSSPNTTTNSSFSILNPFIRIAYIIKI